MFILCYADSLLLGTTWDKIKINKMQDIITNRKIATYPNPQKK